MSDEVRVNNNDGSNKVLGKSVSGDATVRRDKGCEMRRKMFSGETTAVLRRLGDAMKNNMDPSKVQQGDAEEN